MKGTKWDAPITLTQGDAIDGSSTNWSKHFRAERVTIAYNTLVDNVHGIEIGFDNNGNYGKDLKDITIANNLITGSENSLVAYIDGNTGSEVSWFNNLIFPTGTATLTSNSSTFTTAEVINSDPLLTDDGTVWRTDASSPSIANGVPNLVNNQDIEGQTRPAVSNYDADHFSSDATLYKPLTANDVGPFSNATTSIQYQPLDDLNVLVYPIPAKDFLIIDDIPTGFDQLYLYNIKGEQIIGKELQSTDAKIQLDLSAVSNGIYTISLLGEKGFFAKKIMILK